MTKQYFKVTDEIYTDPNTLRSGWVPLRSDRYHAGLIDLIRHWQGKHWSWGQSFCVICRKKKVGLSS